MDPSNSNPPPAAGDESGQPSLLEGAAGAAAGTNDDPNAWLPEKFRVTNDAGELDEAASARKLAESYTALEKHKGPMMRAPDSPEGYKIEPLLGEDGKPVEGIDIEAFTQDAMFQDLAKKAHAAGIPNEHLQFFVHEYLQFAPDLFAAGKELSIDEASQELSKVWGDQATFDKNMGAVIRTVREFTKDVPADQPGSNARVIERFGNDPDFVAFLARVGGELKFGEDTLPGAASTASDVDVESLMKSEAYWNPQHKDHTSTKAKVAGYFATKFPPKS